MKTRHTLTTAIRCAVLELDHPIEDYDARRLLVKGYAQENLASFGPALIIAIKGSDYVHSWLAIRNPDGMVLVEYSMYADLLPVETYVNLRAFALSKGEEE